MKQEASFWRLKSFAPPLALEVGLSIIYVFKVMGPQVNMWMEDVQGFLVPAGTLYLGPGCMPLS
jgi:hypothetical protein